MNRQRPAEREDTFNIQFGGAIKTMTRRMMQSAGVGETTMIQITDQASWEKFLMED